MAKINVRDRNKDTGRKPNWEYRFEAASIGGKRKTISKSGFSTKKEALQAGAKAMTEYNNGGLQFKPCEISFCDYLDFWVEQYCEINYKFATQLSYKNVIKRFLQPVLGGYKLNSITPAILQTFINDQIKKGTKINFIHIMHTILVKVFDYAIFPLSYLDNNPATHIQLPQKPYSRERTPLTAEEIKSIMRAYPFGHRYHIPLMLGIECGLRISEACAVTWDDIDFKDHTIKIDKQFIYMYGAGTRETELVFAPPKYNSYRVIKIGQNMYEELKAEKARQETNKKLYGTFYKTYSIIRQKNPRGETIKRIICDASGEEVVNMLCVRNDGTLVTPAALREISRSIKTKLGIQFSFHVLRHTHATTLIERNVSPKIVQQRLGHRNVSTTMQTYIHATDAMQDEAVKKIDEAFSIAHDINHIANMNSTCGQTVDKKTKA